MRNSKLDNRKFLCSITIGLLMVQVFAFAVLVEKCDAIPYDWYYKPTSYSELVSWYQALEATYPGYIEVFKANELYSTGIVTGGYDLYYVRITNESNGLHKPEVFFSGGPHGNEKIGTIGLYWFADWMMRYALHSDFDNPQRGWLRWLLNNREIYICVCHNPWGFDHNARYDANGWDLNREADHGGPGSPTGGIWGSVNGKTLREFVSDHVLRIGVWFHDGARAILYPWKNQHPGIYGTSPISGRTYERVPPDFYFYDAACLRLGDYVGNYGGDLNSGNVGNSYTLGFGGPGVIPHWAYGADVEKNPAEDPYVQDETFGNYPGAGMLGLDPEIYGDGNPSQDRFGNDTINRFGAEIRRYVLYSTDLAQPYLVWQSETPENNALVNLGTLTLKWQVSGCLVVDHTYIQWGTNPDPINNPEFTTNDHNEHASDYVGGTAWDNAENGAISGVTYSEAIAISTPGDYYFVAKAQVDQVYANVLAPGEYGNVPYLRLVKERTNDTYYEELSGADGLEQINGQLWWYTPVIHVKVVEKTPDPWWNTDWSYRKEITVNHTKVSGDLSRFPVLIDITDGDLASKAQSAGDDIVFTDGNGVKLNHEIELYDSTTGRLVAWVCANLSSTIDTILYMYYGNAVVGNQENVAGVWNSNFMMVQHLGEISGTHYDSTVNDNDGSPQGGLNQNAVGKVDGADDFDGTDDYVSVPHDNTLTGYTSAMTASAWIKLDDISTWQTILNKYDTAGNQRGWVLDYRVSPSKTLGFLASSDGSTFTTWTASFSPTAGSWYYVAAVWQSNQIARFYVNGQQVTTTGAGTVASIYNNTGTPLYIGRAYSAASPERNLDGVIDEARVSNVARSAGWISTSYNNQYDSSMFYTVGTEEIPIAESVIRINPATTEATLGEDYAMYIEIACVSDLYAWEFQLNYDPAILDLMSALIVPGGLNEPIFTYYSLIDEIGGHLWWAVSTIYPTTTGVSYDEHAIFEMHFHTIAIGTAELDLFGTFLSDSNADPISHSAVNGSITVSGETPETDLLVTNIAVFDYGCSIYANDTYVNGTAYYYPVEITIYNNGTQATGPFYIKLEVYWISGSLNEDSDEKFVPGLNARANATFTYSNLLHPTHNGYYRITVTADSQNNVTETNETNNMLALDNIRVSVVGDINGDGNVNILDAVIIALAWDAEPLDPHWNIRADINHDGYINILDGVRMGLHWGEEQ